MLKIGGFYELKDGGYVYNGINECIFVYWDNEFGYDEEYCSKKHLNIEDLKNPEECWVAFRSKKHNMFYAMWDGANKFTFRYLLPKEFIEAWGLKKMGFPENYNVRL